VSQARHPRLQFRRLLPSLALLIFALGFPVPVRAQGTTAARFADFDAFVAQALAEYRVPGAAVVVVEDGKVAFIKGFGVRDITKPGKVDQNTIFQLASVSKTFTAAVAGTLVDQRKFAWDEPVIDYLPRFVDYDPYVTRHMTMRDLLAMRTGWPQFTGDMLDDFGYTRAEILERVRHLKPAFSFREVSQYSNLGYFIAGEAAAQAGAMSWNDLVENRLLAPLGMTRSGTSVRDLADPNSATPHAIVGGAVAPTKPSNQDTMGAAGAVTSTASDMARWLQLFLNDGTFGGKTILKRDTVAAMFARSMVGAVDFTELPPISETTGFYYGLGFDSFDYAGYHVIEKAGALNGVRTVMTMVPAKHAGIVVLSNLNVTTFPEAVRAYYVEKTLLEKYPAADLQEIRKRNARMAQLFAPAKPPARPIRFAGPLAGLAGTYANPLYGRCTISLEAVALRLACGPAKHEAPLVHWNGGQFIARWPGATNLGDDVTFTIGADGAAKSFTDDALGVFERVR
jgi:CubicO group peptidase (beta-lactamase class C family)